MPSRQPNSEIRFQKLVLLGQNGTYKGHSFPVKRSPCMIGRTPDNDIALAADPSVSGHHCRIEVAGRSISLVDLGSKNGNYHNGLKVTARQALVPRRSILCIGRTRLALVPTAAGGLGMPVDTTENLATAGSIIIPSTLPVNQLSTESLLVVDICDSTMLAHRHGEEKVCRCVALVGEVLEAGPAGQSILFLKCTGDGFFATFPNPLAAVQAAASLLEWLRCHPTDVGIPDVGIRIGIHHGALQTDPSGDRVGLAANLVFRLQAATLQDCVGAASDLDEIPERDRILVTDDALTELPERERVGARRLGLFLFKGFESAVAVYLWS